MRILRALKARVTHKNVSKFLLDAGIRALLVHAQEASVRRWYASWDFEPSPTDPYHHFTAQRPEGDREPPVSGMGLLLSVIPPRIHVRQEKTGWIKK